MAAVADGARQGFLKTKRLTEFQASGVLTAFQRDGHVLVWDCGLGKSVGAIALAVLCVQEGLVEHVLVVCERNKVREWVADFETDTDLQTRRHHGSGRLKKLETGGVPPVLVTTYETAKRDLAAPRGPRSFSPGPLLAALKGKNILVVYDESAKLRNRSSGNYKAHQYALGELRKAGRVKVLGLTATPLERGYEDGFNQLRLIVPEHMPLVKEFESRYVLSRDPFGRPTYNKIAINEFVERVGPHLTRKRKTDPDVIDQFPPLVEEYRLVELPQAQRDFYNMAEDLAFEMGTQDDQDMGAWMLLRQIAGHPASLVHSAASGSSRYAKAIVEALGTEFLRSLPSAKLAELEGYLRLVVKDQGAKAVVFSFFGQSVLPEIEGRLRELGYPVFPYHGGQTAAENELSKKLFKESEGAGVFLASDAGARGINLPEATYVIEFESALTHAARIQRRERAHRINSALGPVTALTLIAEGTIEESIFNSVLRRNEDHDHFAGDAEAGGEFVSAADRREILRQARQRYEARQKRR